MFLTVGIILILILSLILYYWPNSRRRVSLQSKLFGVLAILGITYIFIIIQAGAYHNIWLEGTYLQKDIINTIENTIGSFRVLEYWGVEDNSYSYNGDQGFPLAFVSSALESLVFFFLFGLVSLLAGVFKPESTTVDNRINYLLSAKSVTHDARNYASRCINKLACFNSIAHAELIIEDICLQSNCIKIRTKYGCTIKNMFHNSEFRDDEFKLKVKIDKSVEDSRGSLTKLQQVGPPALLGQIVKVCISKLDSDGHFRKGENLQVAPINMQRGKIYTSDNVNLVIAKDSQVEFESENWVWENLEEEHTNGVLRFTDEFKITVQNLTQRPEKVIVEFKDYKLSEQAKVLECLQAPTVIGDKPIVAFRGSVSPNDFPVFKFKVEKNATNDM